VYDQYDYTHWTMTRRRTTIKHTFAGQDEGDALALWLNEKNLTNEKKESRARLKVAQLVQDMALNADSFIRHGNADRKLTERIDHAFSKFRFWIETIHVQDSGRYKTFPEARWWLRWSCAEGQRVADMVLTLTWLAQRGLLQRIRRCIRCSRWFFGKVNHQRFCGKQCQELHYQTGEYWKQKRRERYERARTGLLNKKR